LAEAAYQDWGRVRLPFDGVGAGRHDSVDLQFDEPCPVLRHVELGDGVSVDPLELDAFELGGCGGDQACPWP
jgi:hypothetical protein